MVLFISNPRKRCSNIIAFIFASNLLLALLLEMCCIGVNAATNKLQENYEDNEFAEFEELDDEQNDPRSGSNNNNNKFQTQTPSTNEPNNNNINDNNNNKDFDES